MMGPRNEFSEMLHTLKYRQVGETFRDAMNRVSSAMVDEGSSTHYHAFRDVLMSMRFVPAGRVQSAMGAARDVTALNCFVSGVIPDSFVHPDSEYGSSIMHRAAEAASTMRMGGGIGYDFSTLRPRGALIRKLQSQSSGPVSFMHVFNAVGEATASAGHRRGAQMGVLRVDHPDIVEFINIKHKKGVLEGFNLSVAITDDFMECVIRGSRFDLEFGGEIYQTVDARELWETIMRSTWDWADPGVLFIDTINNMNNLHYCERIAATNPCGEQTLPPFGACLLGSFNLTQYLSRSGSRFSFDYKQLEEDIAPVVRAMDNVVERSSYPLPQQEEESRSKRRMGLGVLGLANAGETLGYAYGSPAFLRFEARVLTTIRDHSYRASMMLAQEKGSFPLFDAARYSESDFVRTLPKEIRADIRKYGIRNSHLTSIAPTGTISMCCDNVSSGIEPVFSEWTQRSVNVNVGSQPMMVNIQDYAAENFGTVPKVCEQVTAQEHVDVLCTAARLVDSAVSKTCNVTGKMPWDEFKDIYRRAWDGGAKGCTTFNIDGEKMALLRSSPVKDMACTFDPTTGTRSCE
jgi:ribonucleoside-diphosphate reductase alpha chain